MVFHLVVVMAEWMERTLADWMGFSKGRFRTAALSAAAWVVAMALISAVMRVALKA